MGYFTVIHWNYLLIELWPAQAAAIFFGDLRPESIAYLHLLILGYGWDLWIGL